MGGSDKTGPAVQDIRHTPLMPAEGTTLEEVLETFRDGYEIRGFHFVVLGGSREEHKQQLETLLEQGALQPGAMMYSDGPGRGDSRTEEYLEFLQKSGGHFEHQVHEVSSSHGAQVAVD